MIFLDIKEVLKKYKAEIGMAFLILYTILLGIGTFAEVFEVQEILDWWIFKPPGK